MDEKDKEIIDISKTEITEEDKLNIIPSGATRIKFGRFIMGALSSVPWVGGVIAGASAIHQGNVNELQKLWLEEHKERLLELAKDIQDIVSRLDGLYDNLKDRIESEEYLVIVRKAFKSWDNAETKEKRHYIKNLVINAAAIELCVDDLVRLFNDWLDTYHEAHFKVIREIFHKPGITRGEIWDSLHQGRPREDSAEADLYKRLIRDLSMGGVIRQEREVTSDGEFIRPHRTKSHSSSNTYESAFEDTKPYELTELGKQFVHYTMTEAVKRIGN